jgi:hypothetical protein
MRVIKIVELSPMALGRRWVRVVECAPEQTGYEEEQGVQVLWESRVFYVRSREPKGQHARVLRRAERIAAEARVRLHARLAAEVGLTADAPPEVVQDLREERGL